MFFNVFSCFFHVVCPVCIHVFCMFFHASFMFFPGAPSQPQPISCFQGGNKSLTWNPTFLPCFSGWHTWGGPGPGGPGQGARARPPGFQARPGAGSALAAQVSQMPPRYSPDVSQMLSRCLPDVSQPGDPQPGDPQPRDLSQGISAKGPQPGTLQLVHCWRTEVTNASPQV